MKTTFLMFCTLLAAGAYGASRAEEAPRAESDTARQTCEKYETGDNKPKWERQPSNQSRVTRHRFSAGGKSFDYTATAGTLVIRDDYDRPIANIGYVAYSRDEHGKVGSRPILFAFNGGPGYSSIFLHMGLLGPKRVIVTDAGPPSPAPYNTTDNEFSVLDKTDVVLIDPVGTGLSHAVCRKKDADFWSVDADVDSISRLIAQFVSDHERWSSPKYLLGESYGTTRAAAIVDYLRAQRSLTFNGVIFLSAALDMEVIFTALPGNERPYATYLPSFAAAAWYYHLVPGAQGPLEPFLEEVRRYAEGPFATALLKGNALSAAERDAVAEQVHQYTGLSTEYIKAANFRISEASFAQELLKSRGRVIARLDARFSGSTQDAREKDAAYDPSLAYLSPPFMSAFQDYYHHDLGFGAEQTYQLSNSVAGNDWNLAHKPLGAGQQQTLVNSTVDLAQTMVQDPNLKVLVLQGYFDLGSPFATTEYMMSHLQIPQEAVSRIQMKYYDSGHMIYVHLPSLRRLQQDLDQFLDSTH
ncbi:MAG: peptidase serine carboxypeptidase [Caballeronia mineralivorans]|nr:peptidase serine carboxypeptidase [Caballeronia mineralivorans]